MPPRKRRTKKANPERDAGAERNEKCKSLVVQFELMMETKLKRLDEMGQAAIAKIKSIHNTVEMNLPKHIRDMKVGEFKTQGDLLNILSQTSQNGGTRSDSRASFCRKMDTLTQKFSASKKVASTSKRPGLKRAMTSPKSTKSRAGARKAANSDSGTVLPKQRVGSKRQSDEVFNSPPRIKKRASQASKQIITPKFDLRKPVAANRCRAPRPGETLVSLSGSPLQNPPQQTNGEVTISVGGKLLDLGAMASASKLDQRKKKELLRLQEQISRLVSQ